MTFFDASDVAQLRADQLLTMQETATIARPVTSDGGTAVVWTTTASAVPCCVRGGVSKEVQIEGETKRIVAIPLVFPYGTSIPEGARFTVGSRVFRAIGLEGLPSAAHRSAVVVLCQETL